jgi:hypothetical protein
LQLKRGFSTPCSLHHASARINTLTPLPQTRTKNKNKKNKTHPTSSGGASGPPRRSRAVATRSTAPFARRLSRFASERSFHSATAKGSSCPYDAAAKTWCRRSTTRGSSSAAAGRMATSMCGLCRSMGGWDGEGLCCVRSGIVK